MNDDKISVFGGSGFIGGNFCEAYENESIVIPREQRSPESKQVLYFISTIHNYNVFEDPQLDIDTNLRVLVETLEECKDKDVVFNFVSSWFVYGETGTLPVSEGAHCNPKGFYSITKRTAEQLLISYCETFDIKYRIFRLSNVYGNNATKVSVKRNALQHLTGEVVSGRDINLYNGGEDIRDFMHVEDVCTAIKLCMDKSELNDIINIGSGVPIKFGTVMEYVKTRVGSPSKFNDVEPPDFHKVVQVKDMYLDVSKLKALGFNPKREFWDEINDIIRGVK